MSETAQLYQKLLEDAIHKQMTILGPQITLLKARNVNGLTVTDDGKVATLPENSEELVTRFIEEFRELSSPLVKKTMQPLLSAIGPTVTQAATQTVQSKPEVKPEETKQTQESGSINQGEKLVTNT